MFYDPDEIDTATMLDLIIKEDCPKAKQTFSADGFVLNPMIAAGDPVQVKIELESQTRLVSASRLPEGWKFCSADDTVFAAGTTVLTLTTDTNSQQGAHELDIRFDNGQTVVATINVVEQVGVH